MKFHCEERFKAEMLQSVSKGKMAIFLGAGFSYTAEASSGGRIPMASDIAKKIADFAGLKIKGDRPLSRVYDAAVESKGKHEVNEFLRIQYSGCQATWQKIIPEFLWKRIYTTNIDDVLNSALKKCSSPVQGFDYKNYNDRFEHPREIDDTQVISLHGTVRKSRAGFVFGGKEYATAIKENLSWHIKFSEDYATGGIVFVGSQMMEPDLELYTLYRSNMGSVRGHGRYDSFLVLPDVDDVLISAMAANGIACIEATGEEFFNWLNDNIHEKLRRSQIIAKRLPEIARYTSETDRNAYIRFKNQFHFLSEDEVFSRPEYEIHDFFSGDTPDWWDIQEKNDAILTPVDALIHELTSKDSIVVGVRGSAGCGKTATLMRTAYELMQKGWQVYFYEDEGQIDVFSARKVIRSIKQEKALIVVDNVGDTIDQVNELITGLGLLSRDNKLQVKFLLGERENRLFRVLAGIKVTSPILFEVDSLNATDINRIIDKLEEKDKLKQLRGKNRSDQIAFFKNFAENQLLVAMRELAYGARFDDIISNEYKSLKTTKAKRIYAAVALCHSQRHSVSPDVIYRALMDEISRDEIEELIERGELRKVIVFTKDRKLATRHVSIAQSLLRSSKLGDSLARKQKADLLTRLMKALAPVVNIKELVRGSAEALLAKAFMDYDHIENVFGEDEGSIEFFFKELKPLYEWNSKYWAQRALFESKRGHFSDAVDFANYAVKKDGHWTIRSASGLVHLRASCSTNKYDYQKAKELLQIGTYLLEGVIVETGYNDKRSIMTLFDMIRLFALTWDDTNDNKPFEIFEKYHKEATTNWRLPSEQYEAISKIRAGLFKKKLGL